MCGRYTQTSSYPKLADRFGIPIDGPKLSPRYNIAPTQEVPVIVAKNGRHIEIMRWGLIPHWAKDPTIGHKMINARAETLREKPSFRGLIQSHRCIIPASGFFEWKRETTGKSKVPMYFTSTDGEPLGLAGLWDEWKDPKGHPIHSFTIITTEANGLLKPIHDRMPVILERVDEATWIGEGKASEDALAKWLRPCREERLTGYAVGTEVNSPKNDLAECIQKKVRRNNFSELSTPSNSKRQTQ